MVKTKVIHLYNCTFGSTKGKRDILVCSDSFGHAASIANSIANGWEDSDAFSLVHIHLSDLVAVKC